MRKELTEASGILAFILDNNLVRDQFLIGRMVACVTASKIVLLDDGWTPIVEGCALPPENHVVIVWCEDNSFGPAKMKAGKWCALAPNMQEEIEEISNAHFWRYPFMFGPPRSVTAKEVN